MPDAFPMEPEALARAIDMPLEDWPGNCHGVASAVRELVPVDGMRLARGHWLGAVSRESVYRMAPVQHSWLVAGDGRILDPTRWAIVRPSEPFIYLGACDDYDEGGLQLKASTPPPFPGTRDGYAEALEAMDEHHRRRVAEALGCESGTRVAEELRHAMREDPSRLPRAAEIYAALEAAGRRAMVPMDSWLRVMEPQQLYCRTGSNRTFALPPAPEMGETEILSAIFSRFLSEEERPGIEEELEELGYELERDLRNALEMLDGLGDLPVRLLPSHVCDPLSVIAGDLLGKGFGQELRVERFAASLGVDAAGLDRLLRAFGQRSGYSLGWEVPEGTAAEAPSPAP